MTETHKMNTKARTLQRRGPGRAGGSSVSVFLSLSHCVCVRERERHVQRMTMTPGAEADRKQGVQCGGQSDGQTDQHTHTHTTKHPMLERNIKAPNVQRGR